MTREQRLFDFVSPLHNTRYNRIANTAVNPFEEINSEN